MSIKRLHPPHELTEQYELLKVRVLTMLNGKAAGPVVVAFTSCEKDEGVSSVAANFASTLADDSGRKVLLMDGDLRRPTLHTMISLAHRVKKPRAYGAVANSCPRRGWLDRLPFRPGSSSERAVIWTSFLPDASSIIWACFSQCMSSGNFWTRPVVNTISSSLIVLPSIVRAARRFSPREPMAPSSSSRQETFVKRRSNAGS